MNISLNGKWTLYFGRQDKHKNPMLTEERRAQMTKITATVPGNAELDLMEEGYLPKDIYMGENILEVQKYEDYEWWYETTFQTPADLGERKATLCFEGVDTIAEYLLNGEIIGKSRNMFIPIELDVTGKLKAEGENLLQVHLYSVMEEVFDRECPMYSLMNGWDQNFDSVNVRKAAHNFGWDIMPRVMTNGLWRDVYLHVQEKVEVGQLYYYTRYANERSAMVRFCYDLKTEAVKNLHVEISGKCGDSTFFLKKPMWFKAGWAEIVIDHPKLWWPYGYGEAALYDTVLTFYSGEEVIAQKEIKVGIRTVELKRTDETNGQDGCFEFHINGVKVMCKGSNWVPMDAFHGRDKERYDRTLKLFSEIGCNMIRCWGGNVYEDEEVYDYCDAHGIMIWQDFAMGCHPYPQDEDFLAQIREEAEAVVRKFRNHPALVLWAGDNECDELIFQSGSDPNQNRITREVLPQVIEANDCSRPYLPSSPYVSPKIVESGNYRTIPEAHLWGPRDYFKSPYYMGSTAHFISETGYHGCPALSSIEKFIDSDHLWPLENNSQWVLHSSDQRGNDARIHLLPNQIQQLFGEVPTDLEEFIFASQISQAEADKFFIENMRAQKEKKGGILWWNLMDGWPQFSDAVVDYYYEKKIAFDYIKRSQQPFVLMCAEMENWHLPVVASNDTLQEVKGSYTVKNLETGEVLLSGNFDVAPNSNASLGRVPVMYSDKGMLLIEWQIGEEKFFNHYLYGMPGFDLKKYKEWFGKLQGN
ncbi:MAG: hypothetical protein IJ409_04850 [Lachnospiraceae bacterium]|nr:hypothetical protein [Lachnospiraceae bacterium]